MDLATTTTISQQLDAFADAHPWKFALTLIFLVIVAREFVGFMLHTGAIKDELRDIKRLLKKK